MCIKINFFLHVDVLNSGVQKVTTASLSSPQIIKKPKVNYTESTIPHPDKTIPLIICCASCEDPNLHLMDSLCFSFQSSGSVVLCCLLLCKPDGVVSPGRDWFELLFLCLEFAALPSAILF